MGTACLQRICPGSSASKAGENTNNMDAPRALAPGEETSRDLNQRIPSSVIATGSRKTQIPMLCSNRSLTMAPNRPIQLLADWLPRDAAVFRDGSVGE